MKRFRKWLRMEIDVEFLACTHGMSMVFMYGFLLWLIQIDSLPFAVIFQMFVLSYLMAWLQKALFLGEKKYTAAGYFVREIFWCLVPLLVIGAAGVVFHWFRGMPWGIPTAYYALMTGYMIMAWFFLKNFYQADSEEMNRMLKRIRDKKQTETGGNEL